MTLFEDVKLVNNQANVKLTRNPESYVYYRVYAEDGVVPSKSPMYTDDPYLARIWAKQVALPRTVMSLKRCLSAVENIDYKSTNIFASAKSETPMDDCSRLSFMSSSDLGTPDDPMILFVKTLSAESERLSISKPEAALLPPPKGTTPFKVQFLYYRIYTEDGAIISKHPVDSEDLSLGRIDIVTIAPPHTITSIKLRIAKAEQLSRTWTAKLFADMSSESPIDPARISILTCDRPGCKPEKAMVYVHSTGIQLKATRTVDWACTQWLDITEGEILHMDSDGVPKVQQLGNVGYEAYTVCNSAGTVGFVCTSYAEQCS